MADERMVLTARWSKRERDVLYHYPRSCDGHLLHGAFGRPMADGDGMSLIEELEKRGYDLTTLRFSIKRKGWDVRDDVRLDVEGRPICEECGVVADGIYVGGEEDGRRVRKVRFARCAACTAKAAEETARIHASVARAADSGEVRDAE